MDSLALDSPAESDSGSTPQPKASTKKGKGKSVAINSEPESPTPSGSSRRRTTTTGTKTRNSRKTSKSTSQNSGSSTPADPAPAPAKRRPRLSMRDPLSHLSLIERSILLKIKEDAPAGVHVKDIAAPTGLDSHKLGSLRCAHDFPMSPCLKCPHCSSLPSFPCHEPCFQRSLT